MRYDSQYWFPGSVPLPAPVVNKSYLLMCEVRGAVRPTPTIRWYLGRRPITTGKHFYIIVRILLAHWRRNVYSWRYEFMQI